MPRRSARELARAARRGESAPLRGVAAGQAHRRRADESPLSTSRSAGPGAHGARSRARRRARTRRSSAGSTRPPRSGRQVTRADESRSTALAPAASCADADHRAQSRLRSRLSAWPADRVRAADVDVLVRNLGGDVAEGARGEAARGAALIAVAWERRGRGTGCTRRFRPISIPASRSRPRAGRAAARAGRYALRGRPGARGRWWFGVAW